MELFEFLFPEQAETDQLRNIAKILSYSPNKAKRAKELKKELKTDINFLSLVVMVLIKKSIANGDFTIEEFVKLCHEVDALDGNKNGALNIDFLRGALGILKEKEVSPKPKRGRKIRSSKRNK